jgi:hypothetical protein
MSRIFVTLSFLLLSACAPFTGVALADSPNILIMAEDADADGVPRQSRISTRVLNAVVTQMVQEGFKVYDETALTLDTHKQGRSRRTDAELIDIAKSLRKPPIDVVVFFTIFSNVTRKSYSNDLNLRIVGRLLNVHDGRKLGNWEEEMPDRWSLPNRCFPNDKVSRSCLLEAVGSGAKKMGRAVSSVLAERLAHLVDGNKNASNSSGSQLEKGYSIIFEGFGNRNIREIEEYLVIFSGYKNHRPTTSMTKYVEFWYESTIRTSKLRRNLEKMMEEIDLDYAIKFSGNKFTIRNKNIRRQGDRSKRRDSGKW